MLMKTRDYENFIHFCKRRTINLIFFLSWKEVK